jgi:hypothetical protein
MKTRTLLVRLPLIVLAVGVAGFDCNGGSPPPEENRGVFGATACAEADRVAVTGAAYAIYLDQSGAPLPDLLGEDLTGTESLSMCPTVPESGPGACPAGYCPRTIGGKTYCLRC